jgi:hypothetical protein
VSARVLLGCVAPLLLAGCAGSGGPGELTGDFESDFARAKANAATPEGRKFDEAVDAVVNSEAASNAALECTRGRILSKDGYRGIAIFANGGYGFDIRPKDPFSECFTRVLFRLDYPKPPAPYYLLPIEIGG